MTEEIVSYGVLSLIPAILAAGRGQRQPAELRILDEERHHFSDG